MSEWKTPSREISSGLKRLQLQRSDQLRDMEDEVRRKQWAKGRGKDDSFNSSFESDPGSPFVLGTRKSMCFDKSFDQPCSPLLRDSSISFPRSKTDPIPSSKPSNEEEGDDEVFPCDEENQENEEFSTLVSNAICTGQGSSSKKRPRCALSLSGIESFNNVAEHPRKRDRPNGTTPTKLNINNDLIKLLKVSLKYNNK